MTAERGDTIYGNSPLLPGKLRQLGRAFVLEAGEQLKVYLSDPLPSVPRRAGGGRGRKPVRPVSNQSAVELRQLIEETEAQSWQAIEYRLETAFDAPSGFAADFSLDGSDEPDGSGAVVNQP